MDNLCQKKFKPLWRIHNRTYRELMKTTRPQRRVYYAKLVRKLCNLIMMKRRAKR